ncbi:MAG: molybdopterin cofactor-binding domain-containing protein [Verrucomicrobiales bacterium]|nr:molybdopterin-dependent oxidoreductase [Verrucomicrobiae bacterium]MCP5552625.1 molybdopterin-dependent oxidoreductase [Akkermansiaceae bacterium]
MSLHLLRPDPRPLLKAAVISSPHPAATLGTMAPPSADEFEGDVSFFFAADFAGIPVNLHPEGQSNPVLAAESVSYWGQPIGLVVGESWQECRRAAAAAQVNWHPSPALHSVAHAAAVGEFLGAARKVTVGDPATMLAQSPRRLEGALSLGSQAIHHRIPLRAMADPDGPEGWTITVATSDPGAVRKCVSRVLNLPECRVTIRGGATAGGEGLRTHDAALVSALAGLAALRCRGPVELSLDHEQDAALAGQRHGAEVNFTVGFDENGHLLALDLQIELDGGCDGCDAPATVDRLLLHALGGYSVPHLQISVRTCRTNRLCRASLPGEGAAQGTLIAEEILSRVAQRLGRPAHEIRGRNLSPNGPESSLFFGQRCPAAALRGVWEHALADSDYLARREAIQIWNETNSCYKRGLAVIPILLGKGGTAPSLQRASAEVRLNGDGSVNLLLGIQDDRSGMDTQAAHWIADRLGLPTTAIGVSFDESGRLGPPPPRGGDSDLLQGAVSEACQILQQRLRPVTALMIAAQGGGMVDPQSLHFSGGRIGGLPLVAVVGEALKQRIPLTAETSFSPAGLWWDDHPFTGAPFHDFQYGAAVAEVQLDAFSGECHVLQADLFYPAREGEAEVLAALSRSWHLGHGWMILENTHTSSHATPGETPREVSPAHYALPGLADLTFAWRVHCLPTDVPSSSGGEEAGVMLAVAIRDAVREAIRAFAGGNPVDVEIPVPSNPETILRMLRELSRKLAETRPKREKKAPARPSPANPTSGQPPAEPPLPLPPQPVPVAPTATKAAPVAPPAEPSPVPEPQPSPPPFAHPRRPAVVSGPLPRPRPPKPGQPTHDEGPQPPTAKTPLREPGTPAPRFSRPVSSPANTAPVQGQPKMPPARPLPPRVAASEEGEVLINRPIFSPSIRRHRPDGEEKAEDQNPQE